MMLVALDRLICVVGVAGGLVIMGLVLLDSTILNNQNAQAPEQAAHKVSDLDRYDVQCWTPSQFTSSMDQYADQICKSQALYGKVYLPLEEDIPRTGDERSGIRLALPSKRDATAESSEGEEARDSLFVLYFVAGELVVAVVCYFFARSIKMTLVSSSDNQLSSVSGGGPVGGSSRRLVALYVLLYVSAAICWILLGGAAHGHSFLLTSSDNADHVDEEHAEQPNQTPDGVRIVNDTSGVILCDFSVRSLGNVQRYTVQCTFSLRNKDDPSDVDPGMVAGEASNVHLGQVCLKLNLMLSVVVFLLIICHIIVSLIIYPVCASKIIQIHLRKAGVLSEDGELPSCVGLTDLYLALLYLPTGAGHSASKAADVEMPDLEPFNKEKGDHSV